MESRLPNIALARHPTSISVCILIVLLLGSNYADVLGQSGTYQIQTEDRLQISFWESPELNSQVTVGKDGGIALPVVGRITAAGLMINELHGKIISQMALYNRLITQLSVTIVEYGFNRVYVTGHIGIPGKHSFEEMPNLWDVILEAGGPLETAALDEIVIVRSEEDGMIFMVNLSEALRNGRLNELPSLHPGDTIHVPGLTETGTTPSPLVKQDIIFVFGAVASPGPHKFKADLNVMEVIGLAGGPTQKANLKKIKHVSVSNGTSSVVEVNLAKYIDHSFPAPMPVGPGDTIIIPTTGRFSSLATTLITSLITTSITFLLIRR